MSDESLEFCTDDVVIADDGRVTISNPEFTRRLIAHVKRVAPETVGIFDNCDCKGNAVSKVSLDNVLPSTNFRLAPGNAGIFDNCSCTSSV